LLRQIFKQALAGDYLHLKKTIKWYIVLSIMQDQFKAVSRFSISRMVWIPLIS